MPILCTLWYSQGVALQAVCKKIQDALDKAYYEQLQYDLMGYKQVTMRNYFKYFEGT